MSPQIPTYTLNNGVQMPVLGFGVFQAEPEQTLAAVSAALQTGYRHVDTAASYGNERQVGEAVRRSRLDRSEVFVETKVWVTDYGYEQTLQAFDKSAGKLGVEQIDLLILHQPAPREFDRTLQAYRALERLLADGAVRAIGVSNFMPDHMDRLLADRSVVPAVNQIEVHPYFRQSAVLAANTEMASARRRGRRSAASPSIPAGARTVAAPWPIPPSRRSLPPTARPPLRSCCAGTCTRGVRSSPRPSPHLESPRTSTSSTSHTATPSSPPSTRSTPASAA